MNAIDRIAAGLRRLRRRSFASSLRHDEEGRLRIIAPHSDYEQIVNEGLRPLREAVERSPVVSDYLDEVLDSGGRQIDRAAAHRGRTNRQRRSSESPDGRG